MVHYIDKDRIVAEIERRRSRNSRNKLNLAAAFEDNYLLSFIDTLEVKEVGLEKEIRRYRMNNPIIGHREEPLYDYMTNVAKHFFELGLSVNNPVTAADRGTAEEIIINLKRVEQDYRIDLTKEIEWARNQVKKGE